MDYDLLKSFPSREYREDASQNGRMEEVSDILLRSSRKDEAESGKGSAYRGDLYTEQEQIVKYAETHNCWFSLEYIFQLGTPGPSCSENDTYVDKNGGIVYKTNNLIHTGSFYRLFRRLMLHNSVFPQTKYILLGFTGYKERTVYPVLAQRYVENARPATPIEIEMYMLSLGFEKVDDWTYKNSTLLMSDLKPKNVLRDEDGDMFVIDVEIKEL